MTCYLFTAMIKGIRKALIYYAIGFSLAGLVYLIFGHPYIHAPGLHHIVMFLTLIIGAIWALAEFILVWPKLRSQATVGFVITIFAVIAGFVAYIAMDINRYNKSVESRDEPKLSLEVVGDETTIYYGANIIYYKHKDSVYLDFTKDLSEELRKDYIKLLESASN